ncbi:hypothetical protein XELAEV_18016470mg [Xenopus laevis]|uniref:CCHC-type domain-containing protein n=1 Tax=Xenopus laevis TaxID=8355 RepID=A0A974DLX7_XENLA|nr:hypothetical protein XELAEV_18016470mg [Xenopus laevis]
MRKKPAAIAGQGVRTRLGSKKKTSAPGLAAAVENIQVHKEVLVMAKSDSKEGECTSTCSVPSVMESPKQANTLVDQAEVAAESCSSAVGSGRPAVESCSSEASQEAAARHFGSQEGSAAGCEEAMESAETTCCVTMEVLREKPNPAAMAQVGAIHLCQSQCDKAAGSTNMAAGSTNMAAPLTNKTVGDAAVRENVTGESSVTEGAGNPHNVSEVGESQTSRRKNEVKIMWVKERGEFPGCRFVARNLIKESLGFTSADVFGLVTVTDTELDLSFKLSQGLDDFWHKYEVWLKRQWTVLSPLTPLYDEEGFWIGGGKVQVKLHVDFHVPKHLPPNSFFICKYRGVCFYPGQSRCNLCGETGHPSKECQEIHCNLCLKLGHAHNSCPDAWHNIVRDCPNLQEEIGQGMEIVEEGAPKSEVVGSEREVVQPESSAPCSKVKNKPPKMVLITGNRFVLPEGKSWGDLAEEEEERLREEEMREKRKAGALGKRNRKRKEGQEEVLSQEEEWESLEEDIEIDLEGEESTP